MGNTCGRLTWVFAMLFFPALKKKIHIWSGKWTEKDTVKLNSYPRIKEKLRPSQSSQKLSNLTLCRRSKRDNNNTQSEINSSAMLVSTGSRPLSLRATRMGNWVGISNAKAPGIVWRDKTATVPQHYNCGCLCSRYCGTAAAFLLVLARILSRDLVLPNDPKRHFDMIRAQLPLILVMANLKCRALILTTPPPGRKMDHSPASFLFIFARSGN